MDYSREYFTIEALESGLIIINSNTDNIWYRKTGGDWIQSVVENSATFCHTIEVQEGEKIQLKAIMPDASIQDGTNIELDYVKFTFKNTTIKFNVLGNFASLFFDASNIDTDAQVLSSEFITEKKNSSLVGGYGMFANTNVQNAHNLILESNQYIGCQKMFANCTELTAGPDITITTYNGFQYTNMFIGCTSLATDDQMNITRYDDIIALLAADIVTRMNNLEEQFAYYSTYTNERFDESNTASTQLSNNVDTHVSELTSQLNTSSSYASTNIGSLTTGLLGVQNELAQKYTYLDGKINTNTTNDSLSYTYLLSKVTSLENSINTASGDIQVSEYDDSELREYILSVQTNLNNSVSGIISRVETLEAKPDKDTVYDDTELRESVDTLQTRYESNTLYDASALIANINSTSNSVSSLNTYVTNTYSYVSDWITDTNTYINETYAYVLEQIDGINNSGYVTNEYLENCGYITISDVPTVSLTGFATTEYVDNKVEGLHNYDDLEVKSRITALESANLTTSETVSQLDTYTHSSYAYSLEFTSNTHSYLIGAYSYTLNAYAYTLNAYIYTLDAYSYTLNAYTYMLDTYTYVLGKLTEYEQQRTIDIRTAAGIVSEYNSSIIIPVAVNADSEFKFTFDFYNNDCECSVESIEDIDSEVSVIESWNSNLAFQATNGWKYFDIHISDPAQQINSNLKIKVTVTTTDEAQLSAHTWYRTNLVFAS